MFRRAVMVGVTTAVIALGMYACGGNRSSNNSSRSVQNRLATATPIKHVVVIFNENVSFDHYFATYPNAANPAGEPQFTAAAGTPSVNGLSGTLLTNNPNFTNQANGTAPANPVRLDPTQAATPSPNHAHTAEQPAS